MLAVAFGPASRGLTSCLKLQRWVFPGAPVVKNLPSNAGGASLIPLRARAQVCDTAWNSEHGNHGDVGGTGGEGLDPSLG